MSEHINNEPRLDRVLARSLKYTNKIFNFGLLFNNAMQRKKSFKRLIGKIKSDQEGTLADDFAEILDQFLESMSNIYKTEMSDIKNDFPTIKKLLLVQENLISDDLLPKSKRINKKRDERGHKIEKKSKISKKQKRIQLYDPITPKWESLGRKLSFLSNKDSFHDEIGI